jgi:hypothetical protein
MSLNNTIVSEGHGWRERYKARQDADLRTIFVALAHVPVPFSRFHSAVPVYQRAHWEVRTSLLDPCVHFLMTNRPVPELLELSDKALDTQARPRIPHRRWRPDPYHAL